MRRPIGVVDVTYWKHGDDEVARSRLARDDGFAHIDVMLGIDPATLALPVGIPIAFPKPVDTWCTTPAPMEDTPEAWDRAVRWWRAAPHALCEPFKRSPLNSIAKMRAFQEAVPGVRFLVDTGHVADWDEDPCEALELADAVQLRQGCQGSTQVHCDDARGAVDFDAVFARLDQLGSNAVCSVEYFDMPELGWSLDDPRGWARDLLARLRGTRPGW